MIKQIIYPAFIVILLIIISCEQKVNTPDDKSINILGNWELISNKIITTDSTIEKKPGIDIPLIMRVFSNDGSFEELINNNLIFSYSKNQWSIANRTLTLKLAHGITEQWEVKIDDSKMILQRPTTYLNQSASELIIFQTSDKIQFKNNTEFLGNWNLTLILRISGDKDTLIIPQDIGLSETLTINQNANFAQNINDNGVISNFSGNWFNTYYIVIFKYSNGQVKLYSFNLEPGTNILALEYSYYHSNELVFERREYTKQ